MKKYSASVEAFWLRCFQNKTSGSIKGWKLNKRNIFSAKEPSFRMASNFALNIELVQTLGFSSALVAFHLSLKKALRALTTARYSGGPLSGNLFCIRFLALVLGTRFVPFNSACMEAILKPHWKRSLHWNWHEIEASGSRWRPHWTCNLQCNCS